MKEGKSGKTKLSEITDWEAKAATAGYHTGRLAVQCGFSVRHLERHFLQHFGVPPRFWLDRLRLSRAKEQLVQGLAIKAVAIDLGFKDSSHFFHKFKHRFGCTPGQFIDRAVEVERSDK